jgi:hypothetical protein
VEATVDPRWEFTRVWRNLTAGTSVARLAVAFAEPVRAAAELTAVYADAAIRGDFTEAASPIGVSIKAVANCLPAATITLAMLATVNRRRIQTRVSCPAAVSRLKPSATYGHIRSELHQHGRASGHEADLLLVNQVSGDFGEWSSVARPRTSITVVNAIEKRHHIVVSFGI